jgi:DNA-directed RNA polymerase specialized sigma24 family protein
VQSIPTNRTPDHANDALTADTVHGLPWARVFTIRNAIAREFFRKFHEEIPLEEFLSEGNQAMTEALAAFDPHGPASLATWLYRALRRRMWDVVKREWKGTNESIYASHTAHAKRLKTIYKAPQLEAIPDDSALHNEDEPPPVMPVPLTTLPIQDTFVYLHECLAYVAQRTHERERIYLWHSLDGDDCADIGRQHHRHKSNVRRALHQVRQRLSTWSEAVSSAAAD